METTTNDNAGVEAHIQQMTTPVDEAVAILNDMDASDRQAAMLAIEAQFKALRQKRLTALTAPMDENDLASILDQVTTP